MSEVREYFERGALERDLNTRLTSLRERNGNYDQYTDGFDEAVDRVENFPAAANVAPVVYGRWINGDPYCPVCKKDKFADLDADVWADWQPDYCPNCGAKMDGGDSDMETAPDGFCSHGEPREGEQLMLKPTELTKAELLRVVEILAGSAEYELARALGQIEMQRNDAHYEKSRRLIDEEKKHYDAYLELLRPYAGMPVKEIPADVFRRAMEEWEKARAAGKEWDKLNGIRKSNPSRT